MNISQYQLWLIRILVIYSSPLSWFSPRVQGWMLLKDPGLAHILIVTHICIIVLRVSEVLF